ncbi:MAG: serine/threonine protein phosphatase [Verrucomicrobiae bacterium]|jgi:serine/threonine protein phosphatase 1|nr:serine/threonine protein phosphatase [Verrucomicrobiae bacterium]
MRTFAIGDVHGCLDTLIAVLEQARPDADDRIVFLGDYVDRGPDSRRLIDWLIAESSTRNLVTLRGNHEIMMLESRYNPLLCRNWLACGGLATLDSYGWQGRRDWPALVPQSHWDFLENTAAWLETEKFIFVHANAVPNLPMQRHNQEQLFWDKCHSLPPHCTGKRVIVGHTRQTSGIPREFEGGVCIDTAAVSGHWLTCLDVDSGNYWQANIEGTTRAGRLETW